MKICFTEIEDLLAMPLFCFLLKLKQLLCTYESINVYLAVLVKPMDLGIRAELPFFCPQSSIAALQDI